MRILRRREREPIAPRLRHFGTIVHMQAGMYGAFIVERDDPIRDRFPYTREHMLLLSSIDTVCVRDQLDARCSRMRQRDELGMRGRLDLATQIRYSDLAALRRDAASGNPPTHALSRVVPRAMQPNFFTINGGKPFPATEDIVVREGEWTRLCFADAGGVSFAMHLHGHDFYHVCADGAPLPAPVRMSTIQIVPGRTDDIVFLADNPGLWAPHDHERTDRTTCPT